jgi:murein DD-endopeptidase MepM/ murein hydrolase activator NlpD
VLSIGQRVTRGEAVALSGDMYGTCHDSPHLHLEIRDESLGRLYNPVTMIDADWHSILLLGAKSLPYEVDLDNPGRWLAIDDQPNIRLGGPILNDYEHSWPEDGS